MNTPLLNDTQYDTNIYTDIQLYFLHPNKTDGFIIDSTIAHVLATKILVRYGGKEQMDTTRAKTTIWNILHKHSIADMTFEEWKKLKQPKPKFAIY